MLHIERPQEETRPKKSLWAYLSDVMPVDGAAAILEQKRVVDAIAQGGHRQIDRYIVDSGSALTADGCGLRLQAMLGERRALDHEITLVVADVAGLATKGRGRRRVLADLLAAVFVVQDRTGALQPHPDTIALARAAAQQRALKRRRQAVAERDHG